MNEKDPETPKFFEIHQKSDAFFKEALDRSLANQHLQIRPETSFYLLEILTRELRSDPTADQKMTAEKAVAIRYREVLQTPLTKRERAKEFRALGDSSLVIAGIWWPSLIRKPVNVDYYIAIGSRSYQRVSEIGPLSHTDTFKELSEKFRDVVNILTEATLCILIPEIKTSNSAILRVYELYLKAHNPFFKQLIRSLNTGVVSKKTKR